MLFVYVSSLASLFIVFSTHPMTMGLTLLIQTICVALMTGFLANNFWFSYILFIVMVGGMLVLFIYMTSVASNEKFYFSKALLILFLALSTIMTISLFFMDNLITEYQALFNVTSNLNLNLNKYVIYPYNIITIMMIFYLLITLIAVVKISKIKYGPLRHVN
uniref:NADH-ubiquinone oxidoreductase chain 6 n=1 Tax=Sphaeridium bipustulatum TaxID=290649 RepID=A0A0S2M8F0_9COLE|nr:NADH dehydrogenase subunit 6 [Sphaeridium bipustulatum]ALO70941.1 NADH deshydrogenase subunit 6 [Sphaeridium bipustulatum]